MIWNLAFEAIMAWTGKLSPGISGRVAVRVGTGGWVAVAATGVGVELWVAGEAAWPEARLAWDAGVTFVPAPIDLPID